MNPPPACFCGNPAGYAHCCQPLHDGRQQAQSAEQLMRSRFSAFCSHNSDYLVATHHPDQRQPDEARQLQQGFSRQRWVWLEILDCQRGGPEDLRGEVEFIAWYLPDGDEQPAALHERSRFVREHGRWLYVDGIQLPALNRHQPDIGRNAPCWCGSGRKFKRCHGAGDA